MITLFTDLDDTLIYGNNVIPDQANAVLVEMLGDKPLSYMTLTSHAQLSDFHLRDDVQIIPVTTRIKRQYERICMPQFHYALISNGATLLIDGEVDEEWQRESERLVAPYASELRSLFFTIANSGYRHSSIAFHDNMFVQGKFENPAGVENYIRKRIVDDKCSVYVQHQKVYVIPKVLDKGNAIARFRKRFSVGSKVISAGDNLLDFSMADYSDVFLTSNRKSDVKRNSIVVDDKIFSDYIFEYTRVSTQFGRV